MTGPLIDYDISIVTICYNKADGFDRTARSYLAAKEKAPGLKTEWIVMDGGSDAETTGVQARYADHMAYYQSRKDGGIYPAMNAGMDKATGKYVVFMNAGDEFTEDALQIVSRAIDLDPEADFICGERLYQAKAADTELTASGWCSNDGQLRVNDFVMIGCHQSMYFSLPLIRANGIRYDESYRIIADVKFFNAVKTHVADYVYTSKPLTIFESGGISETGQDILDVECDRYIEAFEADVEQSDIQSVFVEDPAFPAQHQGVKRFTAKKYGL